MGSGFGNKKMRPQGRIPVQDILRRGDGVLIII